MRRFGKAWLGCLAIAVGAGGFFAACGSGDVNLSCDPTTDPTCGDGGLPDGAIVLPDGAVILPDGQIVSPDGTPPIDAPPTDAPTCRPYGDLCASGGQCCSGVCDSASHCTSPIGACKANLQPCSGGTECCSLSCVAGACSTTACVSDGQACASNAQCCGGSCSGGTCQPLNTACKTAGNACTTNAQCCSSLCKSGKCELAASYCTQLGDVCARGTDCCTGVCTIGAGKTLGTCTINNPGGTNCTGVDGTVCNGCGDCCSRLCAPFGPTGVHICQPANGCHVTGDLCKKNADCCGAAGSGVPGDGNVTCEFMPGETIGVCRNPMSCNPEGDVCHYKADTIYQCTVSSSRNDCCAALGAKSDCKLDTLGIPRCNGGGACKPAGGACAYSGDCCSGLPCVPNPAGTPPFVCGATTCEPAAGPCTIDGDCCKGLTCNKSPGSASGSCGGYTPPPTDAGTPPDGSPPPDGSVLPDGGMADTTPPTCSLYGQGCSTGADCCNGVDCRDAAGALCGGSSGGCTCHYLIQ
jgi:hypothetical protein